MRPLLRLEADDARPVVDPLDRRDEVVLRDELPREDDPFEDELALAELVRAREVPDPALEVADFLRPPPALRDLELLDVPLRLEPERDRLVPREAPVDRLAELVRLPPELLLCASRPSCSSPSSSSLDRSFFATPAAAVVATPAATPAATFFVSDIPSSFSISSSEATLFTS